MNKDNELDEAAQVMSNSLESFRNQPKINIKVIGFMSLALLFSADRTGQDVDLIDAVIDYVMASALEIKGEG